MSISLIYFIGTEIICIPVYYLIPFLSHECYYHQMTSETRVTNAKHDKKQDLDIIIPVFVVNGKIQDFN